MTRYYLRPLMLGAVLIAALGLPFSASAGGPYYLSLGDSLAFGFQPMPARSDNGYADQLLKALQAENPSLQPKKLGCYTDETTVTMVQGKSACSYLHGSQLNEAVAFLANPNNKVVLITIDIGANEVQNCTPFPQCVPGAVQIIKTYLPAILQALHKAAPDVPIVGMNYYDPLLASYIAGDPGFAKATLPVFDQFNDTLERIYRAAGSRVANVEGAFSTTHFMPSVVSPIGPIPLNVALICQWTYTCSTNGNDNHPNDEGYGVITRAFLKVLPHEVLP